MSDHAQRAHPVTADLVRRSRRGAGAKVSGRWRIPTFPNTRRFRALQPRFDEVPLKRSRTVPVFCWVLALCSGWAAAADGCSCITEKSPLVALGTMDAVFRGRAAHVDDARREPISSGRLVTWTFANVESWKGTLPDSVRVRTEASDVSCGYPFKLDGEYLVYCRSDSGGLRTDLCTRTRSAEQAQGDLDAFAALGVRRDGEAVDAAILDRVLLQAQSADSAERAVAREALRKLGKKDPARVNAVLGEVYRLGPPTERAEIVKVLAWVGSPANGGDGLLRSAVEDPDPTVRWAAVYGCLSLGIPDAEARAVIDRGLQDPDARVRTMAVQAAGSCREGPHPRSVFDRDSAWRRLEPALRDTSPEVRRWAVCGVGAYASDSAAVGALVRDELSRASRDPAPGVRGMAVAILAGLQPRDVDSQQLLLAAVADTAEQVRYQAFGALRRPGPLREESAAAVTQAVRRLKGDAQGPALEALTAMIPEYPPAYDSLVALYPSLREQERWRVLERIPFDLLDPDRGLRFLTEAARDSSREVRLRAIRMVPRVRGGNAEAKVDLLLSGLEEPHSSTRFEVLKVIECMGPEAIPVLPALERMAESDPSEPVRTKAARVRERIRWEASHPK